MQLTYCNVKENDKAIDMTWRFNQVQKKYGTKCGISANDRGIL